MLPLHSREQCQTEHGYLEMVFLKNVLTLKIQTPHSQKSSDKNGRKCYNYTEYEQIEVSEIC